MESIISRCSAPAVVVAHPDDEALWCSGLILRYPKDWWIICCTTPYKDPERLNNFVVSCKKLGARYFLLRHPERGGLIPFDALRILLEDRDVILTHGPKGEYGHAQHREVHEGMRARYWERLMWFSYNDETSFTVELSDDEWERKVEVLKSYDGLKDNEITWKRLLEYYGARFPLRREPYSLSTQLKNAWQI